MYERRFHLLNHVAVTEWIMNCLDNTRTVFHTLLTIAHHRECPDDGRDVPHVSQTKVNVLLCWATLAQDRDGRQVTGERRANFAMELLSA